MNLTDYDLELEKAVSIIKKEKAKLVCIQLPDGLKPCATEIAKEIEEKTKAKVLIWFGSCFGACDIPDLDKVRPKIDLLIQWGHSPWPYKKDSGIKVIK
jgi:diphthamide biosynthesis enzyme Dph1/Dph2-like protein